MDINTTYHVKIKHYNRILDETVRICRFRNGKTCNADLNAAYNIGARYFIRELVKSLPATAGLSIGAKVPRCLKRSTCTLADLINLCAALRSSGISPLSLGRMDGGAVRCV